MEQPSSTTPLPLTAKETADDKTLSIGQLKYKYRKYAGTYFRVQPFVNQHTGWEIRVSNNGLREIEKFRTRDHIISLQILDKIIESAKFVETVPDNKGTVGIENVSYFEIDAKLNNTLYTVKLTVKKHVSSEQRIYYYHSLRLYDCVTEAKK
jgi:hypothetical protein